MSDVLELPPLKRASGTVVLPGSKSISNRALLLAALSEGSTELTGLLDSDDTQVMLNALRALGLTVTHDASDRRARVLGCAGNWPTRQADLFMGNAGTAIRPLTAALAATGGAYSLSGVARMHERPIGDLVDALRALGCELHYTGIEGYPPLRIGQPHWRPAEPVRVRGNVSSQFLTALLIASPLLAKARGCNTVIEVEGELISKPYIEITLGLMAQFGVVVQRTEWSRFEVPVGSGYRSPAQLAVEGDASSASYFLALGLLGGGPVRIEGMGRDSIQGDVAFADFVQSLGARLQWQPGAVIVSRDAEGPLPSFDEDFNQIPDAAMTAAVLALFARGPCRLRNIASWRVKETDRLSAMATELRKLGAGVIEHADALEITPPQRWQSAQIGTYDDHRMAMCFSLAPFGGVSVQIEDPGCVRKTFPDYFTVHRGLVS